MVEGKGFIDAEEITLIAHDLNNALTVVMGFANSVKEGQPKCSSIYDDMEVILKAGRNANDIIQRLYFISHPIEESHDK